MPDARLELTRVARGRGRRDERGMLELRARVDGVVPDGASLRPGAYLVEAATHRPVAVYSVPGGKEDPA